MLTTSAVRDRRTARRLAVVVLAVLVPVLAGCGFGVQTNQVYQPAVGANNRSETVDVLSAVVVSPEAGKGVFLATLVNNASTTTDKLTSIEGAGGLEVGDVPDDELAPQQPVDLAADGGVPVTGSGISTRTSSYVTLRLSFEESDPVTIKVPVVTPDGPYAGYGASATPLPTPNDIASQGAAGTAGTSPSASATPGG